MLLFLLRVVMFLTVWKLETEAWASPGRRNQPGKVVGGFWVGEVVAWRRQCQMVSGLRFVPLVDGWSLRMVWSLGQERETAWFSGWLLVGDDGGAGVSLQRRSKSPMDLDFSQYRTFPAGFLGLMLLLSARSKYHKEFWYMDTLISVHEKKKWLVTAGSGLSKCSVHSNVAEKWVLKKKGKSSWLLSFSFSLLWCSFSFYTKTFLGVRIHFHWCEFLQWNSIF